MNFTDSITTCFRKYVDFHGRARRSEFWYWVLFVFLVGIVASVLDSALGLGGRTDISDGLFLRSGILSGLASLALFLPGLAVAVRRLHDVGQSGWWVLLNLIPFIGSLILIFAFYIRDSQPGPNQHGPNPKGVEAPMHSQPPYPQQPPYSQPPQQ